jgi:hypothetical protein
MMQMNVCSREEDAAAGCHSKIYSEGSLHVELPSSSEHKPEPYLQRTLQ